MVYAKCPKCGSAPGGCPECLPDNRLRLQLVPSRTEDPEEKEGWGYSYVGIYDDSTYAEDTDLPS